MPGSFWLGLFALFAAFAAGAALVWWLSRRFLPRAARTTVESHTIAERVASVGKLVGLEVRAKEIATATHGLAWLPPLLLSRARLAMIFHFEKQYSINLAEIRPKDVREIAPGRYRLRLPPAHGELRLTDVTPYDVQDGKLLQLIDVLPMTAERQKELMERAKDGAARLFAENEHKYAAEARASIERQLRSLLALFDAEVELIWPEHWREDTAVAAVEVAQAR